MNFLYRDFQIYIDEFRSRLLKEEPKVTLGLAVPYIYLIQAAEKLGTKVTIMAQDLHAIDFGAFTSGVSAAQLSSIEVPASLVGHSECRAISQNSLVITNKVKASLRNGVEVIYCCGKDPVEEIQDELSSLSAQDMKKVIIAFEPLSAIGSGSAMAASEANEKLMEIRKLVADKWGNEAGKTARLLYGGSVNLSNYKEFLEQPEIDGVLVGGASLKIDDF